MLQKLAEKKKARAESKTESHQFILIKEEDSIQSNEGLYNIFQASKLKPSPLLKV